MPLRNDIKQTDKIVYRVAQITAKYGNFFDVVYKSSRKINIFYI